MKFTVARSAFLAALRPATSITNRRSPSPFGSCVVLRVHQDGVPGVVVQSTSGHTSVRSSVGADVSREGVVALPASDLLDRVEAMPEGPIAISHAKDKLVLKSGAREYKLRALAADNFPMYPTVPGDPSRVPGKALREILASTTYAIADDELRVRFTGVVLAAKRGKLTATSSDGTARFARSTANVDDLLALETFLPRPAIDVLLAADASNDVAIAYTDRLVALKAGGVEVAYTKPDTGDFPYDALFASITANDGPSIPRRELHAKIRAVTPEGVAGSVPVVIEATNVGLNLSHTSVDGDESTDALEVVGAVSWRVIAEAKYLLDALGRGMSCDDVQLCAVEGRADHPLVLRGSDGAVAMIAQCDPAILSATAAKKEAA